MPLASHCKPLVAASCGAAQALQRPHGIDGGVDQGCGCVPAMCQPFAWRCFEGASHQLVTFGCIIAVQPAVGPHGRPVSGCKGDMSCSCEQLPLLKILLHGAKHPQRTVNGLLLGTASSSGTTVTDVVPLFHNSVGLAAPAEIAFGQVCSCVLLF